MVCERAREIELERRLIVIGSQNTQARKEVFNGNSDGLFEPGEVFTASEFATALDCDRNPTNIEKAPLSYLSDRRLDEALKQLETSVSSEKDLLEELEVMMNEVTKLKSTNIELRKKLEADQSKFVAAEQKHLLLSANLNEAQKKISSMTQQYIVF